SGGVGKAAYGRLTTSGSFSGPSGERRRSVMASHASVSARPMWRTQPVVAGALAGIAGGLVFGALMVAMMPPMMGMIGSLLVVPSLGWGVHLLFSAIIGAVFGAVVGHRAASWAPAIALG